MPDVRITTHPQSPAPPLPEAAEPVAKIRRYKTAEGHEHWEFVGERYPFFDLPHGEHPLYAAPSPVAQAPAQAGEVARPGPSGDVPSDFQEGQWWLQKLDEVAAAGTDDFKRAVAVVRNLMRTAHAQVATPPAHPVLAPVVREPLTEGQLRAMRSMAREDERCMHEHWWVLFARAIEAAHGIQATTGEQSHG